jgi:4-diphosphocytidyl-2-C-methyl-D-erythritol kinase
MSETVTLSARAKLNLFLRVLSRDDDGYHSLETLFCRIALADTLTATRTGSGTTIEVTGADVGPDKDNLAVRAAELVMASLRTKFGVHLKLERQFRSAVVSREARRMRPRRWRR